MTERESTLEGWGRFPKAKGVLASPRDIDGLHHAVADVAPTIARGNGRSYGDSSFGPNGAVSILKFDRLIVFDSKSGVLTCEAGTLLSDIIDALLPRGWFPPVTPGTKFVTIGGMIASNVHGKNSVLDGAFGDHLEWLDLLRHDGAVVRCSRETNAELFEDTIGGMGLTGIIVRAAFRMRRVKTGWMSQIRTRHGNLDSVLEAFEQTEDTTYRVAWIDVLAKGDALGRSILDTAEHADVGELPGKLQGTPFEVPAKRKLTVPFALPISPLNGLSVRAFNALYYRRSKSSVGSSLVDWGSYFYPLDAIHHWNRIYGQAGFAQYQCVLPRITAREGLVELLEAISASGRGSFLAVLKRLGNTCGTLSFPMDGYTLALDFPWSKATGRLLDRLDEITVRHGGRVYLAKDSRLSADMLRKMQPVADTVHQKRMADGTGTVFASLQSERLKL